MTDAADLPVVESAPSAAPPAAPVPPDVAAERKAAALLALTPPSDIEAERAILGAGLGDRKALTVLLGLRPDVFSVSEHAKLRTALAEIAAGLEGDERLDLVLVEGALRASGVLDELGGRAFLVNLAESYSFAANAPAYAAIVRRKAAQRAALDAGLELARRAAQPDADPATVLAEAAETLKRVAARAKSAAPKSLRQLVAEYPELRSPVVHGLLRRGETVNVIAPTKTGKSWLATDLALSEATGGAFLGLYPCERGDVLYLDNELHDETTANRIPRVADARGIPLADVADRVFVESLRGRLMDIYGLRDYLADVQPGRYAVVILDAYYRFLPRDADENSNADVSGMYNIIDAIADRLGCAFVLIHHASKGSQSGKNVTDVGAGAGAQSRATDTHLILRAHEQDGVFVLDAAARSWPPIQPICLRWEFPVFNPAPDLDPAALKPDRPRRPRPPKEPPAPVKTWDAASFAGDFITENPQPRAAIFETARAAGLSENRAKGLLAAAEAEGRAFRWRFGPAAPVRFATVKQPDLEGDS
jgi:RecA-family ATPase